MRLLWSVAIRRGPSTYRAVNIRPMMTCGTVFLSPSHQFIFFEATICFGAFSGSIHDWRGIYAPGEYMLIDNIAPAGMAASYFQRNRWAGGCVVSR